MSVRRSALVPLVVLAASLTPAAASAAPITVAVTFGEYDTEATSYTWTEVQVRAGRTDDELTLRSAPGGVTLRSRNTSLHLLPVVHDQAIDDVVQPCTHMGARAVFCPLASASETADRYGPQVRLFTGAGDDRVRSVTGTSMRVDASLGSGNDVAVLDGDGSLSGDAGADRLRLRALGPGRGALEGGPGDDALSGDGTLSGGPGNDALRGGARADVLKPGTGADRVDGGRGRDQLAYDGTAAVRVDLSRGWASTAGGIASLRSIEDVLTGGGNDILTGDRHANRLDGGAGHNVVDGGGGRDTLTSASAGVRCGRGRDTVAIPQNWDLVPSYNYDTDETFPAIAAALQAPVPLDCERAAMAYYGVIGAHPRAVGQRVEISIVKPAPGYTLVWELRAGWHHGGRLLGKLKVTGRTRRIAIPLNARGRRCVAADCRASLVVGAGTAIDEQASSILPLSL